MPCLVEVDTAMKYIKRILLVDDNKAIHDDFHKILSLDEVTDLKAEEEHLFGLTTKSPQKRKAQNYRMDSAYQGQEALELVQKAQKEKQPYALAFIYPISFKMHVLKHLKIVVNSARQRLANSRQNFLKKSVDFRSKIFGAFEKTIISNLLVHNLP